MTTTAIGTTLARDRIHAGLWADAVSLAAASELFGNF